MLLLVVSTTVLLILTARKLSEWLPCLLELVHIALHSQHLSELYDSSISLASHTYD